MSAVGQDTTRDASEMMAKSGISYLLGRLEGMADGARYATEEDLRRIVRSDLPEIATAIREALQAADRVVPLPHPECGAETQGIGDATLRCVLPLGHDTHAGHQDQSGASFGPMTPRAPAPVPLPQTDPNLVNIGLLACNHEARIDGPDLILDGKRWEGLYAAGDAWVELAVRAPSLLAEVRRLRALPVDAPAAKLYEALRDMLDSFVEGVPIVRTESIRKAGAALREYEAVSGQEATDG